MYQKPASSRMCQDPHLRCEARNHSVILRSSSHNTLAKVGDDVGCDARCGHEEWEGRVCGNEGVDQRLYEVDSAYGEEYCAKATRLFDGTGSGRMKV